MTGEIADIDFVVTQTEAEALLAEQNFIKRHRPRFNIRLRDDKSYPYVGDLARRALPARLLHAREAPREPRLLRPVLEREAGARDDRPARQGLPAPHLRGRASPAAQSGSPCLEYFIKRCQAPCVGYVSQEEYRENIDTIIRFLSGRYREIERDLEQEMKEAAAEQEFERAALMRNRLRAVRSLLERQRVTNEAVGTLDAIAVAAEGPDANAQVFQVRDGVLADRQSFYLENEAERDEDEVLEEFVLQYYASALSIPPQVIVREGHRAHRGARRGAGRAPRRVGRGPARRARRQAPHPRAGRPQRAPGARPGPAALRAHAHPPDRGARRPPAGAEAWSRSRCGSSASTSRTWARRTRSRRWWCSRAARRRSPTTAASRSAARCRTTSRRWPRCSAGGCRSTPRRRSCHRTRRPTTRASPRCRR